MALETNNIFSITFLLLTAVSGLTTVGYSSEGCEEIPNICNIQPSGRDTAVSKEDIFILSIDGGGVRGILPALLLDWLEKEIDTTIKQAYPGAPRAEFRIAESFHMFAGTSTGGLIALGINVPDLNTGRPLYPLQQFVNLYNEESSNIFPRKGIFAGLMGSKFDNEVLRKILGEYFEDRTMKDLLRPTFIPVYDVNKEGILVFCKPEGEIGNYYLRDVALATSAAPTYLPAVEIRDLSGSERVLGVDGGVVANNPTEIAYLNAWKLYPGARIHVISLGCGSAPLLTLQNIQSGGKIQWARDISSVLLDSSSSMTHQNMARLAKLRGDFYTRIQFKLDQKAADLDNSSSEFIQNLIGYARREIGDPHSPIHAIKKTFQDFYKLHNNYIFFNLIEKVKNQLIYSPMLDLSNQHLEERGLWEVTHFLRSVATPRSIVEVKSLELKENKMINLSHLNGFEGLEFLGLSKTDLNEEGLRILWQLQLPKLERLNLIGNKQLLTLEGHVLWQNIEYYQNRAVHIMFDEEILYKLGQNRKDSRDFINAIKFHKQGTSVSNRRALAELLMTSNLSDDINVNNSNFKEGYGIYRELAAANDDEAQYRIGHLLCKPDKETLMHLQELGEIKRGNDVEAQQESLQKAIGFYRFAAEKNHKRAAEALARLYYDWDGNKNSSVITVQLPIPENKPKNERYQLETALKYYKIAQQSGGGGAGKAVERIEQELRNMG